MTKIYIKESWDMRTNTKMFKDKMVISNIHILEENLSDIVDSDDGIDVDDRIGHTNIDAMSNESQGAESKRNSLSPRNQDDD